MQYNNMTHIQKLKEDCALIEYYFSLRRVVGDVGAGNYLVDMARNRLTERGIVLEDA